MANRPPTKEHFTDSWVKLKNDGDWHFIMSAYAITKTTAGWWITGTESVTDEGQKPIQFYWENVEGMRH